MALLADMNVRKPLVLIALAGMMISGCSSPDGPFDAGDPYEATNRQVHEFNKALDRNVLQPTSEVYVAAVPSPARTGISNGVTNLQQPLIFVNHVLQGDVQDAGSTFFRFGMNTVFGLGGVLDPATDAGIFDRPTDFGETLAVWGVGRGAYIELPVLGPSTARDTVGRVVDFVIDPVDILIDGDAASYLTAAELANLMQVRQDLARVIDALYYESADSYTATRIAYLQNRSRNVNNGLDEAQLEDPYAFE